MLCPVAALSSALRASTGHHRMCVGSQTLPAYARPGYLASGTSATAVPVDIAGTARMHANGVRDA